MSIEFLALALAATPLPAAAQEAANPALGCQSSPATIQANKTLGMAFFREGITMEERLAMLDPAEYVQHNPVYLKYAREHGTNEHDTFRALQSRRGPAPKPGRPQGNPLEIVMAQCDLVTIVHKSYQPDPVKPDDWNALYSFDTFRVRNGKFVEHWDNQVVTADNPPPVTPR